MGILKKIGQKIGVTKENVDGEAMLALLQSTQALQSPGEQAREIEIPDPDPPPSTLPAEQIAPAFDGVVAQTAPDAEAVELRLFAARLMWLHRHDKLKVFVLTPSVLEILNNLAKGIPVIASNLEWARGEMQNLREFMEGWNGIRMRSVTSLNIDIPHPISGSGFPASYPWAYQAPPNQDFVAVGVNATVAQGQNNIATGMTQQQMNAAEAASPEPPGYEEEELPHGENVADMPGPSNGQA